MKVSGVSFGKNVVKYDYPIKEAILSILPLCDELVLALGQSEDDTEGYIRSIDDPKLKILPTVWNEDLREGGRVLADETNKALRAVSEDSDWIFYIQGDEVMHEKYIPVVKAAMEKYKDDDKVDGLLFNYAHFYGSYAYVADSYDWYRREIRVIKNRADIHSYGDAQGFRKEGNKKLNVKHVDAYIYHYGWVKDPIVQQQKIESFQKLWHSGEALEKRIEEVATDFTYSEVDALKAFDGTHPKVMKDRVAAQDWSFEFDPQKVKRSFKVRVKSLIESLTGIQLGEYQNYKII